MLERLGRVTAAHPWRTVACWVIAAITLVGAGQAVGGTFVNDFRVPGVESQHAVDLVRDHFPSYGAASAEVVWHTDEGTLADPDKAGALARMLAEVARQPDVTEVTEPVSSPDGRTAIATVRYGKEAGELTADAYRRLEAAAEPVRAVGVAVDFRGTVIDIAFEPETSGIEAVGLGAALVVLLVAFGSVVAAGLPILVALAGLAVGAALVLLVGAVVDIPTAAPIVAVMLGIAAGIDYALFVVTRFRRELAAAPGFEEGAPDQARGGGGAPAWASARPKDPSWAAGRAVGAAGHAVLFAGSTVVVAILALTFAGVPFIGAMGIAAALTVAVMVVASLTLLPALLGLLGHRVDRLRLPWARPPVPAGTGRWDRWARHVGRRRVWYALAATGLLLLLAAPLLALRLGTPDDGNQPATWPQRRAYDTIAAEFGPGWNAALLLAVSGTPDPGPLTAALAGHPEVSLVTPPVTSDDGELTVLTVIPRHAPQDPEVSELVHDIRRTLAPRALPDGARAYVGGQSAFTIDLADEVGRRLPWLIAAVVAASTLLLVAMFRAPLAAAKAAAMTLLSVGAACGVLVAVFQWGWGLELIGVDEPVPIMSAVPMLLFAILFGLSVDYEVFLLSSIKEEYDRLGDPRQAVAAGLANTGRVITAAAAIMSVVFLSFVAVEDILVRMVGLGLATAVIADATLIRVVLVPAVMDLLGHAAWWPRRRRPPDRRGRTADAGTMTPRPDQAVLS